MGRTAVKSKNSSGSIDATSSASKLLADEGDRRRGGLAGVVPALEGAHHHGLAQLAAGRSRSRPASDLTVPDRVRLHPSRWTRWRPWSRRTIAELRAGREVEGVFACTRKDRLTARSGSPYLAVELRDRSGAIQARAFRDADFLAGQFERGDLVAVARPGRALPRRAAGRGALDPARRRRPTPPRSCPPPTATSTSSTASSSTSRARSTTPTCARCSTPSWATTGFRAELRRAPCTRAGHHAYLGGLLEHTVAVATLALETCALHPRLNSDLLICAALLHDVGKIARVRARRRDRAERGRRAPGPRRARPADDRRARRAVWTASRTRSCTPSRTACSPTTGRTRCRAGASAPPRRSRCFASTRSTRASRARWSTAWTGASTPSTHVRPPAGGTVASGPVPGDRPR